MARPRTPIGTFGDVSYINASGGQFRARTRYRDDDGKVRRISATGATKREAERNLKKVAAERSSYRSTGELTPNSSFTNLVDVWLADLDLEGKVAESTRALYERNMRQLVMPVFEVYALREITVSKVDQFLKRLAANKSYSMAKQARTVLSLAFGLAVRYDAIQKNPVRETSRLRKPSSQAMALSAAQVDAIRLAVRTWRRAPGLSGPPPDGQLEQIIEVMLGTSARIGEVLAIRRCDVDATSSPATVRIAGTIVSPSGKPTRRQPHPKTLKSTRTVSVPSFTAEVLRARLVKIASEEPDHLIFFTRNGTPLTTNNVRRRPRAVMDQAGIQGVTPHSFRRTVATVIDRAGGADLAAELLGHSSSKITKEHPARRCGRSGDGRDPGVACSEASGGAVVNDGRVEPTPLPNRNAMHYDGRVFERVDWSQRGAYMKRKHGITPAIADEALEDPNRVVIDPDYNSESGKSVRIIGFSVSADDVISVIVLEHDGTEYGVNGWTANEKDRRFYAAESEGEADEQGD